MIKRSVTIQGHRTSVSLEAPFWDCLRQIAQTRNISVSALIADIDNIRTAKLSAGNEPRNQPHSEPGREPDSKIGGLSSTIRIFILNWALSTSN